LATLRKDAASFVDSDPATPSSGEARR